MDKRVRERRRWVGRQRGHRRAALLLAFVGLLVVVALFLWLRSSDVFAVKHITATSLQHVSSAEISQTTKDARGVSLLRLSTGPIVRRLAAVPYVRLVQVHRRFPNTLDIELVEYEPAARVAARDGQTWLVAEDGRVLEKASSTTLPLIVPATRPSLVAGKSVPETIAGALPLAVLLRDDGTAASLPPVDRIAVSARGQVVVVLKDGAELRLGDPTELKHKLTVGSAIIEQYLRDGRQVEYVDASVPDRPAVKAK